MAILAAQTSGPSFIDHFLPWFSLTPFFTTAASSQLSGLEVGLKMLFPPLSPSKPARAEGPLKPGPVSSPIAPIISLNIPFAPASQNLANHCFRCLLLHQTVEDLHWITSPAVTRRQALLDLSCGISPCAFEMRYRRSAPTHTWRREVNGVN